MPTNFEEEILLQACRQDLGIYGYIVHGLKPARHHERWIKKLQKLALEGGLLEFVAPPGFAKSTWISQIFIPWYLGNHPDHSILFLTSTDQMANDFNGMTKVTLDENLRHRAVFPDDGCRPNKERGWSGAGLFLNATPGKDPAYRAAGFGTSVIGMRAHGIVMDDPLTQEDAQSPTEQAKAKRFFNGTVISRLRPDVGWGLAITTRWAEGDLGGHLIDLGWELDHLPALAPSETEVDKDGNAIWHSTWPEWFSDEYLMKLYRADPATFNAVWQGDPTSLGGDVFQDESWFRPLPTDFDVMTLDGNTPREKLKYVQYWDFAFTKNETSDYTACVTLGLDGANNAYIVNVFRRKMTPTQVIEAMVEQIEWNQPHIVGYEAGLYDKASVVRDIIREVRKRLIIQLIECAPEGDKQMRARLPAGRAEAGMVFADRDAPWWPEFLNECLAFPNGKNDDMVDALSGAMSIAAEKMAMLGPRPKGTYALNGRGSGQELEAGARDIDPDTLDLFAQLSGQQFGVRQPIINPQRRKFALGR